MHSVSLNHTSYHAWLVVIIAFEKVASKIISDVNKYEGMGYFPNETPQNSSQGDLKKHLLLFQMTLAQQKQPSLQSTGWKLCETHWVSITTSSAGFLKLPDIISNDGTHFLGPLTHKSLESLKLHFSSPRIAPKTYFYSLEDPNSV